MTHPRLRLGVASVLFLGWIGYLAFLVVRTRDPVILSLPQLLHSDLVVLAEMEEKDGAPLPIVKVKEVPWAAEGVVAPEPESLIDLREVVDVGPMVGWKGAGKYLIPLQAGKGKNEFHVTALPWSPGFSPRLQIEVLDVGNIPPPVLKWITERTKVNAEELKANPKEPFVLKRNLERAEMLDLQKELEAAGALVQSRPGEYRIYFATDDAREQLRGIKGR